VCRAGYSYIDSNIKDKMVKDIIPLREKIAKENSVINTEDSELRTALSRENSARSEVYRLNNQSAPLTEHQKEQLDTNLKVRACAVVCVRACVCVCRVIGALLTLQCFCGRA
jgi:hypothetical protein